MTDQEFHAALKKIVDGLRAVETDYSLPGSERRIHERLGEFEGLLGQMRRAAYKRAELAGSRPVGPPVKDQATRPGRP